MPFFNWFAVPEDMGNLISAALSHPKRPEGLCIVGCIAPTRNEFVPHYEFDDHIRVRVESCARVLFLLARDVPDLCIERGAESLDRPTGYFVNRNESTTVVQVGIPHVFYAEGHIVLNPSRMTYNPSKWSPTEGRRVKAPPETQAIFRFLRSRIKDFAKPGPFGKLMTPAAREMFMTNGVLFSNDGLWHDASGAVRGRCHGPSGFSEI